MKIKTRDLTGVALDWAVARAKGIPAEELKLPAWKGCGIFRYLRDDEGKLSGRYMTGPDLLFSSKWEAGGPIIEREKIVPSYDYAFDRWQGYYQGTGLMVYGPTLLIATMRCYVASQMGDEVDVPDGLLT